MAAETSTSEYRCTQCEQPESQCRCEKYCCLCQSMMEVRVCQDGLMYCVICRDACDYKTSSD